VTDLSRLGRNNALVAYYTELFFPERDVRLIALGDTNVILDQLLDRVPFADNAEKILGMSENGEIDGLMNASSATDIYFILRKMAGHEQSKELLKRLFPILDVIEVGKGDLVRAMELDFSGYEDAVAASCAKRVKADHIITRNVHHFKSSPVPAIEPGDFVNKFLGI